MWALIRLVVELRSDPAAGYRVVERMQILHIHTCMSSTGACDSVPILVFSY